MIEVSTSYNGTQESIISVRLVPPFEKRHGIRIERVDRRMHRGSKEIKEIMSRIGYEYSGERDMHSDCYIYVPKRWSWLYRILSRIKNVQSPIVRWLDYHARLFQPHQPYCMFSWWDCTPLFLARKLGRWLNWQTSPEHPANYPLWHMEPDKKWKHTLYFQPIFVHLDLYKSA